MHAAIPTQEWDYWNFSYKRWKPGEIWSALGDPRQDAGALACESIWRKAEPRIRTSLKAYTLAGWEPEDPIGPQNIRLRRSVKLDWRVSGADILLWFMTLGLALLLQLLLQMPRVYIIYEPVECRARLRRPKAQPVRSVA